MNRKKIIILGLGHNFGDSRIYYKQAVSLLKEFDVLCLWGFFSINKGFFNDNGLKNYTFVGNRIFILFKALFFCLKNKADIYVAHDIDSFIVLSMLKTLKWKSKVVFDSHEYYDEYSLSKFNLIGKIVLFLFRNLIKPFYINFFNGVITVTEDMMDYYPKNHIHSEVIYNFPLFSKLENIKSNNKLDKNFKYLVYHGGISKDRGIYEILKIFTKLYKENNTYKLLLIGKFSSKKLEKDIYKIIINNGLTNGVITTGKLTYDETLSYISNKVKFIGLCLFEENFQHRYGIPIKMFEYLYYNIPQIGSIHMKNFNRIIYKNNCGESVTFGDSESAIAKIKKLFLNYNEYILNINKIKLLYSWENEEKKLLKFYNKI